MAEEYWSWGVKKFTPEEQQQVIAENERYRSGKVSSEDVAGSGYYSGQMGDQQQTINQPEPMQTIGTQQAGVGTIAEPEPQPSSAWIAQPENFMSVWQKYDQDPNYQDEHYTRQQMDTLYSVYSANNPGMTPDRWRPLMDNDPYLTGEILKNNWYDPIKEEQAAQQAAGQSAEIYRPNDENKQGWLQERASGDWENLDWIGKTAVALSSNDAGINAPGWTKKTQAAQQALSSAMALPAALKIGAGIAGMLGSGGAAAALANPYVLLAAGVGMAGLTFYEAVSGKEMPAFDKFRELSDIVDTTVEHTIGFGKQTYDITKKNITAAREDPNDAYGLLNAVSDTLHDVVSNAKAMWETGEYTYEMYGSVGDFAIDALKEIFKGEKGTKEGEGWFFNRGLNEKQQLAEGTYGSEGMQQIREMFQEMDALGIDKDIQKAWMQEAVNNAGGTSAFVSDYVAQMLLDVDILTTPLENTAAGALSKVTGNQLGVQAAQINSGNVLTQLPVIGNLVQAVGKQKAPGGIFEFMDIYKNLAQSADVNTLSAADRFFGGINADGTIKQYARTEKTGAADLLPEAKVSGVGNIANNVMNAYMYDAQDTNDIRNRLASLKGEADPSVEYNSGLNNSAEVLTVRDGIRHAINETNPEIFLRQYDESAGARATLQKAADALGMEIKDVISLYSETPAVFEQRVRDYAAQHNGMFADIDVSTGVDPISTIVKGFSTAKDGKGSPMAWNIKQVQYQITTSMIDSMAEYYTEYYGVKPNSTINTVFDTMKSAQSLLLLGWSPSYFINNVINNAVTSAAEGVLGFMTPTQIRQWMGAFGVAPSRMDIDTNAEFRGQTGAKVTSNGMEAYAKGKGGIEAFTDAASKAKKEGSDKGIRGALTGINNALRSANNKLGVFSTLSGLMETMQGNQLTAVAIQQYWGQRWKRGEGFHLMPDSLVQTIEAQNPGMTNVIYQAIENGLNMKDVSKALLDTYVKPDAGTVMKDLCADLFRGEAHVYEEILEKSGVMSEIRERFANCTTDEERQAVMDSVQQKLDDYINNLKREDLIQRANNVAAVAESEGLAPVAQIMSEMEMNHVDFWIRQRKEWTDAYARIMTENLDGPQSRSLLADLVARQQKEWSDLNKQEVSTAAGVMKGLGFQNESHARYIGYMNEKSQNWQDFNTAKSRELARAYERTNAINQATEKGKKADRVKINEVWEDFYRNVSELYDQHFAREQEMQGRMDAAFVEGYEFATQKSGEQLRQNFDRIREIRQRMHDMQQDAHEKTSKMSREDKAAFYEEFNPKYNALIREIGNLGDANAQIIDNTSVSGDHTYENHAPVQMTPEQTVQATEVMDTSNAVREQAMRERRGFLDRDGIREGWIESGRTPAEADLMMAVYDTMAEQWAKDNGMYPDEFYSQAVTLKGIAQWLPGTEKNESLFQTSFDEFAEENIDIMPDVNQQLLDRIRNTGTVTIYSSAPIEDGVDVSISRLEIQYAGGPIYSRTVPVDQVSWGDSPYVGGIYLSPTAQQVGTQTLASRLSRMSDEQLQNSRYGEYIKKHFRNKNFREWFGESKITDEYGLPLVVHHGTPNGIFDTFDKSKMGTNTKAASAGMGFFFSGTDETAAWYAHGDYDNIMDVYLHIENPFVYDFKGEHYREETYAAIIDRAKAEGYDGVILKNTYDSGPKDNVYVVFEPEQIKSIHNSGTFSKADPNILKQTTAEYMQKYGDIIRKHYGNANFREWFGVGTNHESKVVDEYGLPLVVHHGSPVEGITEFNTENGTYFTADPDYAQRYTRGENGIEGQMYDCYLYIEKPFDTRDPECRRIYQEEFYREYGGAGINESGLPDWNDGYDLVDFLKEKGYDYDGIYVDEGATRGGISYIVMDPSQIKSIENDGTFNKLDPNILHQQAIDQIKGTFEPTDIGNIIRMLNASDVSTMVHESGHLFRRTLSQPLMQEFTTWAGFESVAEFNELEYKWRTNDPSLTEAERTRYVEAEEKFARGFEQYLMDGSAPTPGLKAVFKSFRDYLLDIYKKVKTTVTGNDYSGQGEFVFHGKTGDEVLNINAEINGVKLRDIFDRMLTDDVQRTPGYTELVQNLRNQLSQDRHNMRMSREALSRRAQVEVTRTILQSFGSMEAAEAALQNYSLPMEINGWRVDDGILFEVINAAKADAQMNPFADVDHHEVKGTNTYAYSITDASSGKRYQLQYKVVELDDLVTSNDWMGDALVINENYPADIQARNRAADTTDVYVHAVGLNPGLLIDEQHAIDSGTPIIGEGNMNVESGNGRVLSLRYAHDHFPTQWNNYQEYLRNSISGYGIDPAQLDSFENPVLIRERLGGDAVSFAEDANSYRNKVMTASENALTDANKVNMVTLSNLDIQPGEGIDTFTTEKNAAPSIEWLRSLQENERAKYSTTNRNGDLVLSAEGKTRFTNALFATLYATPESMDIIRSISETSDSDIQALVSAMKQTLPEMARAEGLIQSGSRNANLSITADVMAAAGLLEDARKAGINIHDYLAQQTIPGMERWTPTQALLAGFFGDAKNNVRMIRDFFNAYGEEVYKSGDPNQLSLFGDSKTREQMINDSLDAALNKKEQAATGSQQPAAGSQQPADGTPVLKQSSVIDSDGRWSSEFAKILDENLQRTFDDGMAIPLDQAESVYLRGDTNVKYETNVQRWLRDWSNDKNLTADQYLYAWGYFEWWVQGSNGEAPKGNPLWEADIQRQVIQDFGSERSEMISELQRRYKRGAEVEPGSVPNKGEYFKRTYGFEHGFWNIAGNVYKDGKLVAYLPEEIAKMKKTIDVDGQSYHVLGVDLNNPEGLVYYDPVLEIVRTVNVGKPEGFEEPRNPFAFIRPARQGSTPQTMPVADAYSELQQKYLNPALGAFMDKYKEADTNAKTAKMSGLDAKTRAEILKWLDTDVSEDMRTEKYRAMKYSDMKKDAAMLNYNQRYGFDPILTMLSPYQFWYTRSMWKWAKRMIDKPALGNAYQRLQEYEDRNRQENLPSRLSGKWRIPMPFLPDWMGGSYYVDLNAQLYPFAQFGQSFSNNMNQATLNARTQEILEAQVQAGDISAEQMNEAIANKKGAVWEDAYAEAETEIGTSNGLNTLASQFISPSIFVSWYDKKQKGEDPGTLSGTRTGNAIRALTQDIPLVSQVGDAIGDAMALPEKALRKLYGYDYNEFGQYGDQQIRKQISQMVADGDITWQQGLNAMNEKAGTIWDMAAVRQRKEAMLKVPGFGGLEAVKEMVKGNASITDAMGAIAMSLAGGGSIYPEGEKTLREMKALRDQAYLDEANGVEGAVSDWYDKYGEIYTNRSATYMDDPEELLKFTLYQQINAKYYDQPYAQQVEIQEELGPEFAYALLNKDTRNYKAVPIETLAKWNAALGGKNPNVGSIDVQGVERVMQLSEPVIDAVEEHDRIKNEQYPGISIIQNGYYALPKDQRKNYLATFPQLEDYWEWNREYKNDHPEYDRWNEERSDYYNEATCYNSYADMSERTQQQLDLNKATGKQLSSAAEWELQQLYAKYANENFLSFADYVKLLQNWE